MRFAVFSLVGFTLSLFSHPSFAQNGAGIQAVNPVPGTSVPLAPTDPVRPPKAEAKDPGTELSPGVDTTEMPNRDAGSSKPGKKDLKKLSPKQKQKLKDDEILEDKPE